VLVDAGLSRREITKRLAAIGENVERLDAILITHEHSDHICGLVSLAKKFNIPIYLTHRTAPTIDWGEVTPRLECFQAGCRFPVGDFEVASFTIPHDAVDPVGYTIAAEGIRVGVVTDLGYVTDSIKVHLRGMNLLLLESNHDLGMLKDNFGGTHSFVRITSHMDGTKTLLIEAFDKWGSESEMTVKVGNGDLVVLDP